MVRDNSELELTSDGTARLGKYEGAREIYTVRTLRRLSQTYRSGGKSSATYLIKVPA